MERYASPIAARKISISFFFHLKSAHFWMFLSLSLTPLTPIYLSIYLSSLYDDLLFMFIFDWAILAFVCCSSVWRALKYIIINDWGTILCVCICASFVVVDVVCMRTNVWWATRRLFLFFISSHLITSRSFVFSVSV